MDVPFTVTSVFFCAMLAAQIPERAGSEMTFAQVEAAAGLPELRSAPPNTFEARIMDRAGQAMGPVPFLRVVRAAGTVQAQLFVFWGPNVSPTHQPKGEDVRCRDGVCVKPIGLQEVRDWVKVVTTLAGQRDCPSINPPKISIAPDGGLSATVSVCPHCPTVWIKTAVEATYREQVCDEPLPESEVGQLRALMVRAIHGTVR